MNMKSFKLTFAIGDGESDKRVEELVDKIKAEITSILSSSNISFSIEERSDFSDLDKHVKPYKVDPSPLAPPWDWENNRKIQWWENQPTVNLCESTTSIKAVKLGKLCE